MKAVIINQFGGSEQLQSVEVSLPVAKSHDALVRIHAAGVNPVDYKIRNGSIKFITGSKFPKILGADFAGVVEQTGKQSSFRPGDKVYGMLTYTGGAYAEFLAVERETTGPYTRGNKYAGSRGHPVSSFDCLSGLT
jgi:NADPH:quinone reductase-like Zn-dependent oxidoreductase